MFVLESYPLAVVFCIITMLCWGSWANTQKLVGSRWRFELFYWDYVFGVVLMGLIFAFSLGSVGEGGRGFLDDIQQADPANIGSALVGGAVFNAANILLVAAIEDRSVLCSALKGRSNPALAGSAGGGIVALRAGSPATCPLRTA